MTKGSPGDKKFQVTTKILEISDDKMMMTSDPHLVSGEAGHGAVYPG